MSQPMTPPLNPIPADDDLIDQAHLGHGVPSHDPDAPVANTVGSVNPVEPLDNLGKEFGIFYPRDHMVVAFQTRAYLEQLLQGLNDRGQATTSYLEVTSAEMIEFAQRNMQEAGVIARLGTSVTTLQAFLDAAKNEASFLVIPTPDDDTADQVTTVLRGVPHVLAERYRMLAIETIK